MKKLSVLAVGAVGYVLGAKAGRARYDQIKNQATKAWNNPRVQSTVGDVQNKATEVATDAKDKVVEKVTGHGAADEVPAGVDVETTSADLQGGGHA